jgi:hypothetical protein
MSFMHGLKKTHHIRIMYFLNRARNPRCTVIIDLDTSKRSTQKPSLAATPSWNWYHGSALSMRRELLVAHEKRGQFSLLAVYVEPM